MSTINTSIRSLIILCLGMLILSSGAFADGSMKQIPSKQFTTLKINGQSHGQFRGSSSFKFISLSQSAAPKDIYYSPVTKWTYALGDFNVFRGIDEDALYAYDSAGRQKWKVSIPEQGYQQLIPGQDNTLFVYVFPTTMQVLGGDDVPKVLYAFDLKGKLKWKYIFPEGERFIDHTWATGHQGSFYAVTNQSIVCIENGKLVWEVSEPVVSSDENLELSDVVSLAEDRSGSLYIKDVEGWVEKWDKQQRKVWREKIGLDLIELVSNDEYIISYNHTSHRYFSTNTGKLVKNPKLDYRDFDRSMLPNDGKGGFYAPEKEDEHGLPAGNGIVKYNDQGKVIWHYKMRFSGYASIDTLMSDQYGNVYFLDNGGRLYSLDSNGNERYIVLARDINRGYFPLYVSPEGVAVSSNGDVGAYMVLSRK